jgi:hypothetical protein
MQAPARHILIKELMLAQKAEYLWVARTNPDGLMAIYQQHQHDLAALRQQHCDARARAQEEKVFFATLRQQHRDERARTKAERAFLAPSKLEPDFWTYYPNHDGRRDTMAAVLVSLGQPKEQATEIMPTYAAWLLTANKTHANGRPMNRWALMKAFVETQLLAHASSEGEEGQHAPAHEQLVEVPFADEHPSRLE